MSAQAELRANELYVRGKGNNHMGAPLAAHSLVVGKTNFGHLYLTSEDYTVAWCGNEEEYPFANDNAWHFISRQLESDKKELELVSTGYDTKVRLRIANEIREFNFHRIFDIAEGKKVYPFLNESTFVRYDFDCDYDGVKARYAFTADNPKAEFSDGGEMAVRLPRNHPLTKWAIQWIVDKHISSRKLKFDLHNSALLGDVYHDLMKMALTESAWEKLKERDRIWGNR